MTPNRQTKGSRTRLISSLELLEAEALMLVMDGVRVVA